MGQSHRLTASLGPCLPSHVPVENLGIHYGNHENIVSNQQTISREIGL